VPERILITGGDGSTARVIASLFRQIDSSAEIYLPSRREMDMTNASQIVEYIRQHPCDLLICAAGCTDDQLLGKTTEETWDHIIQVNLRGAALCAKEASKSMLKKRCGHVIFISSYSALHPPVGQVAYASAKAGLIGLTKALAKEWGRANIRVNTILPGFMENQMTKNINKKRKESVLSEHALQRFTTGDQVAQMILLLHRSLIHTSGQLFNLDSRII
jgi:3-oxoacyl-[acyl-carrier protein] reductase